MWETGFDPWIRKICWRRKWQPTPGFLPGESHGQRSLVGYIPWDPNESGTTEQVKPPPPIWLFQVLVKERRIFHLCFRHVSDQGSNPGSLRWQYVVLATGPPGKLPASTFDSCESCCSECGVQISGRSLLAIPLGVCPETELLDHMAILCVIFGGSSFGTLASIVSHLHGAGLCFFRKI